jgi:hypothetical protein
MIELAIFSYRTAAMALIFNHGAETDVKCGTMETTVRKLSVGGMVLALLMFLFGSLMFLFGYFAVSEWRSERAALIACGAVWILTGPAVFGSALLTARKIDFRRKSNPDWVARIEKIKVVRNENNGDYQQSSSKDWRL